MNNAAKHLTFSENTCFSETDTGAYEVCNQILGALPNPKVHTLQGLSEFVSSRVDLSDGTLRELLNAITSWATSARSMAESMNIAVPKSRKPTGKAPVDVDDKPAFAAAREEEERRRKKRNRSKTPVREKLEKLIKAGDKEGEKALREKLKHKRCGKHDAYLRDPSKKDPCKFGADCIYGHFDTLKDDGAAAGAGGA